MEKYIPVSEGRLTVKFEDYSAGGKGQRITHETKLKNVVATLKGINPDDDRIILISAHLDSRAAVDNDSTGFAPGANDDASGVCCNPRTCKNNVSKEIFSNNSVHGCIRRRARSVWSKIHGRKSKAGKMEYYCNAE